MPWSKNAKPDERLTVAQFVDQVDRLAAVVRKAMADLEALTWRLTVEGVKPTPKAYRHPNEIPF